MDQCFSFPKLPRTPDAAAPSFAYDAATARRVAILDEMAADARAMGKMTRTQATGRCSLVAAKDAFMFGIFDRALRQSIMLAVKLETDARRDAAGGPEMRPHEAGAPVAASFLYDEVTTLRAAMLEAMAADAMAMGKMVRALAEKDTWIDANDAFLFNRFNRAGRQAIMLAEKLEPDARLLAAAGPAAAAGAQEPAAPAGAQEPAAAAGAQEPAAPAGADDGAAKLRPQAADLPDEPSLPETPDAPAALDRLHRLPDKPVGVVVAGICRKLGRRQDLREFTDAELGHDREGCARQASGPRPRTRLPDGWIEGLDGQPVKIGVAREDMFDATLSAGQRMRREPPD